jgi:hypothetical protein
MRVVDFLNRAPSGGAATAPGNIIYFCTFVEEKDLSKAGYTFGRIPARLRLLIFSGGITNPENPAARKGPFGGRSHE